jgi:hypothetical protein
MIFADYGKESGSDLMEKPTNLSNNQTGMFC